jgi:hypothetical protein
LDFESENGKNLKVNKVNFILAVMETDDHENSFAFL